MSNSRPTQVFYYPQLKSNAFPHILPSMSASRDHTYRHELAWDLSSSHDLKRQPLQLLNVARMVREGYWITFRRFLLMGISASLSCCCRSRMAWALHLSWIRVHHPLGTAFLFLTSKYWLSSLYYLSYPSTYRGSIFHSTSSLFLRSCHLQCRRQILGLRCSLVVSHLLEDWQMERQRADKPNIGVSLWPARQRNTHEVDAYTWRY